MTQPYWEPHDPWEKISPEDMEIIFRLVTTHWSLIAALKQADCDTESISNAIGMQVLHTYIRAGGGTTHVAEVRKRIGF